jgi:D-xylulose 5-phosphate/D-fructose 6-phosphate phosphoketolase-like protein
VEFSEATRVAGTFLRDIIAADGRVMEILSEDLCQGWLEGYLLTGRHGLFNPHRRLDGQPARQVAQDHPPDPLAGADRLAELPAVVPCLALGQ